MPLDRVNGEQIEGLEGPYRVVPVEKWRFTPLFEAAAEAAADAFRKAGYPLLIGFQEDQILIQEYPRSRQLAMIFVMQIKSREMLYPYIFALPDDMVSSLSASGLWQPEAA